MEITLSSVCLLLPRVNTPASSTSIKVEMAILFCHSRAALRLQRDAVRTSLLDEAAAPDNDDEIRQQLDPNQIIFARCPR